MLTVSFYCSSFGFMTVPTFVRISENAQGPAPITSTAWNFPPPLRTTPPIVWLSGNLLFQLVLHLAAFLHCPPKWFGLISKCVECPTESTPFAILFDILDGIFRKRMRCTTNIYLTALAITDIAYLTCQLILSLQHYDYPKYHFKLYWQLYGYFVWLCDSFGEYWPN